MIFFPMACYASVPLDLFWGEAITPELDQLNNTPTKNQFQLNFGYDKIYNKNDSASASSSRHSLLAFHNVPTSNNYHFLFAAAYQDNKNIIELENKGDWLSYAAHSPREFTWAINAKLNKVNLHYFNTIDNEGFTVGVEPLTKTTLYVKSQSDFFYWSNTAEVSSANETHHINYSINYKQRTNGLGFHHSNNNLFLLGEYLRDSENQTEQRVVKGEWLLNRNWSGSVNYRYDRKDMLDDYIYINQKKNGRWLQKTHKQALFLFLTRQVSNKFLTVFFKQSSLNYKNQGIYTASELAGYWGDFFVGGAGFHTNLNLNNAVIGLAYGNKTQSRYFKEKAAGLIWKIQFGFGRTLIDSSGQHRVSKVPVGYIINEKMSTDINRIDLAITALSFGYKTKSWELIYEIKQIIPLVIHTKGDDKSRLSSKSSLKLKLPDGNRQTLRLIYYGKT